MNFHQPRRTKARAILLFLLLLPVILLGTSTLSCKDPASKKIDPAELNYVPDSSPANVLANLRQAYIDQNLSHYERLFADSFVFEFNPMDVEAPVNPTPPQWGRGLEMESTGNMFSDEKLDTIELFFILSDPVPADSVVAGTSRVEMFDVNLTLDTRAEDGSPLKQIVSSGHETFYLREFPASGGGTVWRIVRWVDNGFGNPGKSAKASWGLIKASYR